jgi:hypothetical protein
MFRLLLFDIYFLPFEIWQAEQTSLLPMHVIMICSVGTEYRYRANCVLIETLMLVTWYHGHVEIISLGK